jgi:hypothetical protein
MMMKKTLVTISLVILAAFTLFGIGRMAIRLGYSLKYGPIPAYQDQPAPTYAGLHAPNGPSLRQTSNDRSAFSGKMAPAEKTWQWMLSLTYDSLTYEPIFADSLLNLEGDTIVLSGFMVPLEETVQQSHFAISCYPVSECFFCGKSGPESAVEVYSRNPVTVRDERITIRGIFKLNKDGDDQLYYILSDAELVE